MVRQNFTTVSVSLRRDLFERFTRLAPKYGDKSRILLRLIEGYADGKIKLDKPKQ